MSKTIPLQPGNYYHIYNRGNNRENIFLEERNYDYFMRLYARYITPVAHTYAYCLLRNHFHFLIRIMDWQSYPPSRALSGLFSTYTKSINKAYNRTGSLFEKPFKRVPVTSNIQLIHLITYIHHNPQKHGFVDDFRDWSYSSYHALRSTKPSYLQREAVIDWFGNLTGLEKAHAVVIQESQVAALVPEDFD